MKLAADGMISAIYYVDCTQIDSVCSLFIKNQTDYICT